MIKFMFLMLTCAAATIAGLMTVYEAQSGSEALNKLQSFNHWTVVEHWTSPETKTITVLLDEEAVSGTDTTCEAVLDMLDRLTSIVPTWQVKLISPTKFVPVRWNPIDREGVEWMIQDWSDDQRERSEARNDT